jgi:threonine aldolase
MRFASDNSGPVHPKIMAALAAANEGWAMPYGNEDLTRAAAQKVRDAFEAPDAAVYFVATGTAANALLLGTMTKPFQTIFCTPEAHIEEDECNAPEFYTGGAKLTLVESRSAKMDPDALAAALAEKSGGGVHGAQPGPVSLTQVTERGTVYSLKEIKSLCGIAKKHDVPVHLDGARFANAIAILGCTPAEMTWKAGVDAVSFGGTKNGCMGVEAAVIFDPALAWEFELRRKRGGHLFSKNRYLAAQMAGYLEHDLWLDMARAANAAGQALARAMKQIEGVDFLHEPAANMLYVAFPRAAHRRLKDAGAAYYMLGSPDGPGDEKVPARMVADWSCPEAHIEEFAALVRG